MGTRCTAGGEDAGDIPKNRLNNSLKGSDEPNGAPNDIDMTAPGRGAGDPRGVVVPGSVLTEPRRTQHRKRRTRITTSDNVESPPLARP
ncbi:hypothetical protein GCM10010339_56010 [Streptomyces alanosinicus]|uniref:Uncharacterized protein n=1 Tax=Streptomyces alanosinicus TaxID=68171 RepID=A0A918YLG5_9ACTN|nr:hypothetical protein GCM10010339_56010 [Streptomyces alanosinicus]